MYVIVIDLVYVRDSWYTCSPTQYHCEASLAFHAHLNIDLRQLARLATASEAGERAVIEARWQEFMPTFLAAAEACPIHNGAVFRGVQLPAMLYKGHYRVGRLVEWTGFTSTSRSASQAVAIGLGSMDVDEHTAPRRIVLFRIQVLDGKCIESISQYSSEEEVLILPQSRFVVIANENVLPVKAEREGFADLDAEYKVIDLQEVDRSSSSYVF
jgi:hypothetical protein